MAYWWVNQGQTFKDEYAGGFLWAPIENAKFQSFFYWENMAHVKSGDIILSYVDGFIKKVGIALNEPYTYPKPGNFKMWQGEGRRIDIKYYDVKNTISIKEIFNITIGKWPIIYSPIHKNDAKANQGYLFEVPDHIGGIILDRLNIPEISNVGISEKISGKKPIDKTTKEAIIQARVGQGRFRKDLIDRWNKKCAITNFPVLSMLVASHIKPWAISTNDERLDPDNGLLLSPNYNALFDKFLISFSPTGQLLKSERINWQELALLRIENDSKISNLNKGNLFFLEIHRQLMIEKDGF